LGLGATGFVILLLPYVVAQAFDGWRDARAMMKFAHSAVGAVRHHDMWSSLRPAFFASADLTQWLDQTYRGSHLTLVGSLLQRSEGYLLLVGAAYLITRALIAGTRRASPWAADDAWGRGYGLLALWIWTPLALLLLKRGLRPWYYRDVLYPAPFVAGAIVLRDFFTYLSPRLRLGSRTPFGVVAGIGVLLVAVADIGSLGYLRKLTVASGAMPIPSAIISDGPVESSGPLALMPMRYKERIVRSILERTHFEPTVFYRHVHGYPFDGVIEDGGFFFETLASKRRAQASASSRPAPHYTVLGPWLAGRITAVSTLPRAGPFTIIEYRPLIDYRSWAYATTKTSQGAQEDSWVPVEIPTRSIPGPQTYPYPSRFAWPESPVLLRGTVEANRIPSAFRLVAALRWGNEDGPYRVDECRVNDALAPVEGAFDYATLSGVTAETVFNLSGYLHQGRNLVTCRISGAGHRFDLDMYELRD